jgi:hypothetical protein
LAGSAPTDAASTPPSLGGVASQADAGPSASGFGVEAPEECGFPPGTALEFVGRATTAGLGVQEVVGDPMSDEPADIYITADPFDQGDLHGRLVCAVYVDDSGFVEVTVHPEDGGRFVPTPGASGPPPSGGVARTDAIEIARQLLPEPDEWTLQVVRSGRIGQLLSDWNDYDWARKVSAEDWVWLIFAVRDDRGVHTFIDYVDGTVLGSTEGIVN